MDPGNILIVDDNEQNVELLKIYLEEEEYNIYVAYNGQAALALIEKEDIDVVILDVLMPGMDGFTTCRKIKFELQRDELPVIMLTALDEREDRLKGLQAGADDFLTKPVDLPELIVKLRSNLRLKRAYDRVREQYEKLEYQLELARGVQQGLAHVELPAEFNIEIFYQPVEKIGGDVYDVIKLGKEKFGIFLADSSGHGVPAALVMVMLKLFFTDIINKEQRPDKLFSRLNKRMTNQFGDQLRSIFSTAIYLIVDQKEKTVSWVNAGHPYPLLISNNLNWQELTGNNMPLGILPEADYDLHQVCYQEELKILLYTDGLIDYLTNGEAELGSSDIEGIIADLNPTNNSPKTNFYNNLSKKMEQGQQRDDICYMLFNT